MGVEGSGSGMGTDRGRGRGGIRVGCKEGEGERAGGLVVVEGGNIVVVEVEVDIEAVMVEVGVDTEALTSEVEVDVEALTSEVEGTISGTDLRSMGLGSGSTDPSNRSGRARDRDTHSPTAKVTYTGPMRGVGAPGSMARSVGMVREGIRGMSSSSSSKKATPAKTTKMTRTGEMMNNTGMIKSIGNLGIRSQEAGESKSDSRSLTDDVATMRVRDDTEMMSVRGDTALMSMIDDTETMNVRDEAEVMGVRGDTEMMAIGARTRDRESIGAARVTPTSSGGTRGVIAKMCSLVSIAMRKVNMEMKVEMKKTKLIILTAISVANFGPGQGLRDGTEQMTK